MLHTCFTNSFRGNKVLLAGKRSLLSETGSLIWRTGSKFGKQGSFLYLANIIVKKPGPFFLKSVPQHLDWVFRLGNKGSSLRVYFSKTAGQPFGKPGLTSFETRYPIKETVPPFWRKWQFGKYVLQLNSGVIEIHFRVECTVFKKKKFWTFELSNISRTPWPGLSCSSCRSFFRRITARGLDRICRKSFQKGCTITASNRFDCVINFINI